MKTGVVYAVVAWVLSLVLMSFLAPLVFPGRDMAAIGKLWFSLSIVVVALPAFVIGALRSRKRRPPP
jgi:hypothetical protein